MKSICAAAAAVFVLASVACNKDAAVDTTRTTSEVLPAADTNGTTAPAAVPEVAKDGMAKRIAPAPAPKSNGGGGVTANDSTASTTPAPESTMVDPKPVEPASPTLAPSAPGGTTTVTTTTTTTTVKKPAAKPTEGYGTGAARGNGINSTGPVGNGGGGVR